MARRRGRRKKLFKLKLKKHTLYSLSSLVFFFLTFFTSLILIRSGSLANYLYFHLDYLFGFGIIFLPFLFLSLALLMLPLNLPIVGPHIFFGAFMIFLASLTIFPLGIVGQQLFFNLAYLLQPLGARLLAFFLAIAGFLIMTNSSLDEVFVFMFSFFRLFYNLFLRLFHNFSKILTSFSRSHSPSFSKKDRSQDDLVINSTSLPLASSSSSPSSSSHKASSPPPSSSSPPPPPSSSSSPSPSSSTDTSLPVFDKPSSSQSLWEYPPLNLLQTPPPPKLGDKKDFKTKAQIIESKLETFGIRAKVVEVNPGPAVTQYAVRIAEGIKVASIKNLDQDLALALAAPTGQIRIEAPIPGRNLVGIEVPNTSLTVVAFKTILSSPAMRSAKSKLAVGLGLDVRGNVVVADIAKMPHLLIAGATGTGKSVCINNLISTLLFRNSPEELRLILIDPKRVELSKYNNIPHLLTPVIVDKDKIVAALRWALNKMEERYKLLQEVGARDIDEYNHLAGFVSMPKIVIIIDELGDIMFSSKDKVESPIIRLAQMARAVGIHLIIATQHPTVQVITGLIKANFPTRIAFKVTSHSNSQVILGQVGAEKLLGHGDMLFIPPNSSTLQRIQGTLITTKEVDALVSFLKKQAQSKPDYHQEITEKHQTDTPSSVEKVDLALANMDPDLINSIKVILEEKRASTSYLQRRLSIGYNKAARIMDQLEKMGVVGPQDNAKPRQILINSFAEWKAQYENSRSGSQEHSS